MELRWLLVVGGLAALAAPLPGHYPRYPGPPVPGGVAVGGGLSYTRGPLRIGAGFVSVSPYGYGRFGPPAWGAYSSLTVVSLYSSPPPVIVVQPPPIVLKLGRREREREDPDVPDVPDLPPGRGVPPVPEEKNPAPRPAPRPEVDLERYLDRESEPPRVEHARLVREGREAFAAGSYGLAAQKLRGATRLLPDEALPYFLLAEALIAVGRYHEASGALVAGLAKEPGWPLGLFRVEELYGGKVGERDEHRRQLGEALRRHPRDAVLLFLRGQQLWFAGEKKEAAALFRQALPRFGAPEAIERFLAAAGAKP